MLRNIFYIYLYSEDDTVLVIMYYIYSVGETFSEKVLYCLCRFVKCDFLEVYFGVYIIETSNSNLDDVNNEPLRK